MKHIIIERNSREDNLDDVAMCNKYVDKKR